MTASTVTAALMMVAGAASMVPPDPDSKPSPDSGAGAQPGKVCAIFRPVARPTKKPAPTPARSYASRLAVLLRGRVRHPRTAGFNPWLRPQTGTGGESRQL